MPRGLHVVCAAKLHANQLERHLELLERIDEIERITVVRHAPLSERLSKIVNHTFKDGSRITNAWRMYRCIRRLVREENVDWVIGFNPVPWASIAHWATWGSSTRSCISLIGMDFLQIQKLWGSPFLSATRKADRTTVTGNKMVSRLIEVGVAASKVSILPHSVDTQRFKPLGKEDLEAATQTKEQFDILAVGQLIPRKRMDTLIEAVALCKAQGCDLSLGILGKGPLEAELKAQVARLGISELITFLGYRNDVEDIIPRARIFCLASEWEGVPFALMEAMSAGVVPVVTPVGTIDDWVRNGENGLLTPVGDAPALAKRLLSLQKEKGLYQKLRDQLIKERSRLSFSAGTQVWREILGISA